MKTVGLFSMGLIAMGIWGCDLFEDEPEQGKELGACFDNGTCDPGLTCASNICVVLPNTDGGVDSFSFDVKIPDPDTVNPPSDVIISPDVAVQDMEVDSPMADATVDSKTPDAMQDSTYDVLVDAELQIKQWGTPHKIINLDHTDQLRISINSSGNALIAWRMDNDIWTIDFNWATKSWGTEKNIEISSNPTKNPAVKIDDNGNAIAVWIQDNGSNEKLWIGRFDAASGLWGLPQEMEKAGTDKVEELFYSLDMDSSGNAILAWIEGYEYSHSDGWASRYDKDTKQWTPPELFENEVTTMGKQINNPKVVLKEDGNAIIFWRCHDMDCSQIWVNNYDSTLGQWDDGQAIVNSFYGDYDFAVNSTGNVAAIWTAPVAGTAGYHLFASQFDATSLLWSPETEMGIQSEIMSTSQVFMDNDGNITALFYSRPMGEITDLIYASRFDAGSQQWVLPQELESDSKTGSPLLTGDGNGNLFGVWRKEDATSTGRIKTVVYDNVAKQWNPSQPIDAVADVVDSSPEIISNQDGQVLLIWIRTDGSGQKSIWANYYF